VHLDCKELIEDHIPPSIHHSIMKKFLLTSLGLLPLLFVASGVHAQNYTYNCLCLYSDPRGTCREYTCDAYRNNRRSYYNNSYYNNDSYYNNGSNDCYRNQYNDCQVYSTNQQRYWNSSSQYYNNSNDYNWYYNRYNSNPSYYNYPSYNNYPYYY